jgi:predicted nucleic acid-binding protein
MIDGDVIALDSMCLIHWLEQPDSSRGRVIGELYADNRTFVISALSLSEIMVGAVRKRSDWQNAADALLTVPRLTVVDVDSHIAIDGARLRATTGLKLPDALIVATAIAAGADALLSNDRRVVNAVPDGLRCIYLDELDA